MAKTNSCLTDDPIRDNEGGQELQSRKSQPDKRSYTLMLVPHRGNTVYRLQIPIKLVKACIVTVGAAMVFTVGGLVHYQYALQKAQSESDELYKLRSANVAQAAQLDQLAKNTAVLQEEMDKVNQLDAEVRRLLNKEEQPGVSRSGVIRAGGPQLGEGGPVVKPAAAELNNLVQDLLAGAKARQESLANLRESLVERNARAAATPSIWPADGVVSSRFGWRWGGSDWHPGLDIAADVGTPIMAAADGVVVSSDWNGGYGRQIMIDHGNGIVTLYAHNSENAVSAGQRVKKGQLIGYVGSTGYSTGPHVHYEVRVNGTAVNPASFL